MSTEVVSELATVSEVAKELRVSSATVKRWLRSGELPGVRLPSGVWRVPWAEVSALQTHHRALPGTGPGQRGRRSDRSLA